MYSNDSLYIQGSLYMMPLIMNRKVKRQLLLVQCALTVNRPQNEEAIRTAEIVPKKKLKSILQ